MNSHFVRIILPANKNVQVVGSSQQSLMNHPLPCTPGQIRLINSNGSFTIPSVIATTPESSAVTREPLSSLTTNQQTLQKTCFSTTSTSSSPEKSPLLAITGTASSANNISQCDSVLNMGQKKLKRGKNWSEEETSIFINIWSDHYANLMAIGSRNAPIYQSMAQQLNQLLSPRLMTGADVKSKIANLVAEYRKRKKEQGKTGSSPSSWRYFDQIDKLLGERPFNDESLTSDSIALQHEQLEEIENVSASEWNENFITEEADDSVSNLIKEIEESGNNFENRSCTSKSSPNSTSTTRNITISTPDVSNKKKCSSKKKKISDMRIDLIQQIISKIDGANEVASKGETKALVLLEKQTKLHEESLNNEKEFLEVFRSIARNFSKTP
ncbi:unnamed protein product [Rotaria sp. Silwood2]|nr:unnamed protein product [Rotaria sp. Silwood2]